MTITLGKVQVAARGEREVVVTRAFDAPRNLVFDALTRPELVKRWLGVRAGWSMTACEMDVRVGGRYRWVWRGTNGKEMGMGGVFREVVPGERLVSDEKFDEAWYPGDAVVTLSLAEQGGVTTLTTSILYATKAPAMAWRDLASPAITPSA